MKVSHKGYEIFVEAEGIEYKSYYIMRESDGMFFKDGFEYNGETEAEMVEGFKGLIDEELKEDDPWMEAEDARRADEGRSSVLLEAITKLNESGVH